MFAEIKAAILAVSASGRRPPNAGKSDQTPRRRAAVVGIAICTVLLACTVEPDLSQPLPGPAPADIVDVHFVTTRAEAPAPTFFSQQRAPTPSYGRVSVGIPPVHEVGVVEVANGRPDPAQHFHQRGIERFPTLDALITDAEVRGAEDGMIIFLHGYNNSFSESLFRLAQVRHDSDQQAAAIAFQWASLGDPRAYVHDRDSVMLARDALARTIAAAAAQKPERLTLGAHSMGSLLLMEALVRLSLQGNTAALRAVDEIILISPDIDLSLFQTQLRDIAIAPEKFGVIINREDRLLNISSILAGGRERTGASPDPNALQGMGVRVFDATGIGDGDRPGHFLAATSPQLLSMIRSRARF